MVISRIASRRVAPRLRAASSSDGSNFFSRADTTSSTKVVMKDICPSTTSQKLGLSHSISMPNFSSMYKPAALLASRIEMPRMTPGITSGARARKYSGWRNGKRSCSNRKAAMVPSISDRADTAKAVWMLTQIADRLRSSWKMPVRCSLSARNQSSVKPCHGRPGKSESLKARILVITSGENRNTKYSST